MPMRAADLPWLLVLGLICIFHLIRGAWADFAFFVLALLVALIGRQRSRAWHAAEARRHPAATVTGALILGLLLVWAPRHGTSAGVIVCAIGGCVVIEASTSHGRAHHDGDGHAPTQLCTHRRRALRNAMLAWSGVIVLAGLWEASAYLTWKWGALPADVMPSVSDLANPLLDTTTGKAVFVAAWLASGIALMHRAYPRSHRDDDTCTH